MFWQNKKYPTLGILTSFFFCFQRFHSLQQKAEFHSCHGDLQMYELPSSIAFWDFSSMLTLTLQRSASGIASCSLTQLSFHTKCPSCVNSKCTLNHLLGSRKWLCHRQQKSGLKRQYFSCYLKCLEQVFTLSLMIIEAAFSHFKHFHLRSNVTVTNIVTYLSHKTKSCS